MIDDTKKSREDEKPPSITNIYMVKCPWHASVMTSKIIDAQGKSNQF